MSNIFSHAKWYGGFVKNGHFPGYIQVCGGGAGFGQFNLSFKKQLMHADKVTCLQLLFHIREFL